jgi:hypothetical protein
MEIPLQEMIPCKHLELKFESYSSWVVLHLQAAAAPLCSSSAKQKNTVFVERVV